MASFTPYADVKLVLKGKEAGKVGIIDITNGGTGHTSVPTVNITGGGGTGATATATITNGIVTKITITAQGTGYTTNPTVTIVRTGGSGITSTAEAHIDSVDLSKIFTVIEWEEGVPQSIKLTTSSAFGAFQTTTNKILHFDKIYLEYTTLVNGNIESDVFHVKNINRKRGGNGKQLLLSCPHQSSNIWNRKIPLVVRRSSGNTALEKVIAKINSSNGTADPTVLSPTFDIITKLGNNLSTETSNNYVFERRTIKQVFDEIARIEGQPVEGGGSFQPPYIRFKSNYNHTTNAGIDEVNIQAYAQGFNKNTGTGTFTNIPNTTLAHYPIEDTNEKLTNIIKQDSDEDPERATNIELRCSQSAGDYLGDWTKYQGAKNFFDTAQFWATGKNFKRGNLVNLAGLVYEARIDHISNAGNSPEFDTITTWIQRTFTIPTTWATAQSYNKEVVIKQDKIAYKSEQAHTSSSGNQPPNDDFWVRIHYAPTVDYSPETKGRIQDWVNALGGAKHAATDNGKTRIIDPNVIINDKLHPRTYVRFVGKNPTLIPASLKIGGTRIPDAFKMLVVEPNYGVDPPTATDTGEGDFSGSDANGVAFAGNIAQFVDPDLDGTGSWFVFKKKTTSQDQEVYDHFEGDSWTKNPCRGTLSFVDGDGTCQIGSRDTTWIGGSYQIINGIDVTPIFGNLSVLVQFGQFVDNRPFECAHAVKFDSGNGRVDMGQQTVLNDPLGASSGIFIKTEPDLTPSAAKIFNWPFFIGANFWSLNPVSSNAIPFGAVTIGEIVNLPTFDFDNLNRAPDGSIKFFGPELENYYPISKFASWVQFIATVASGSALENTIDLKGDYSFGIWQVDRNDNIRVIDDLTLGKANEILHIEGSLPGNTYKGVQGIPLFFSAQEPDTTDAFDPKEVVWGGIFSKDSFDPQGRYQITGNPFYFKSQLELRLDGWRKIKPLIITNLDIPTALPSRNIETQVETNESIIRYAQGKNLVLGLEKLYNFKRQKFNVDTSGRSKVDVRHGDPVYVTDPELVSDTTDSLPNTLKMVVNKITRTFSKAPGKSPGGVLETYEVITRLYPD